MVAALVSGWTVAAHWSSCLGAPPDLDLFLKGREQIERETDQPSAPHIDQAIEGPVDRATYILGPGDRVAVTMTGSVQRSEQTLITAEGTVIVPPAVGVRVAGKTIDESEEILRSAMRPFFRDVAVRLDLVSPRRFEVYVLGAVVKIGTYTADGATRVSTVVNDAGGVLTTASIRRIQLLRADDSSIEVDLLKFLLLGDRAANPLLRDGDRVVVPIAGEKVAVVGAVGRPGDYEVIAGETVADLVRLAGDTTPRAKRQEVELRRFIGDSGSETERQFIDLDSPSAGVEIEPSDQIYVYSTPDWHLRHVVEVTGEVVYPGAYAINEGEETLKSIVARAGGFTPEASVHAATLTRSVSADTTDHEFERLKTMDVEDMTRDEYEYFKLRSREQPGRVAVDFKKLFIDKMDSEDLYLRGGDEIDFPQATRSIIVSGQVASPGAVTFEEGQPIRWYIDRAGGYGWRAARDKTRVIRARTGEWVSDHEVRQLEVGDTIWVPERPERDYWEMFKEGLLITGQILTVYLVIDTITR